jgi:hypothetical protein
MLPPDQVDNQADDLGEGEDDDDDDKDSDEDANVTDRSKISIAGKQSLDKN